MSYCTQQDLVDRFGQAELVQLTDRTNKPATTIDADVVTRAIDDAASLVDGYLKKAYALPLSTVPGILTKISADIARYFLNGRAAEKGSPVDIAYRDALNWLANVANGVVILDSAGIAPAGSGASEVRTNEPERVFTADTMQDYI